MLDLNEIHHGECLELMQDIPSGSIDMILCDLPYGTTACKWDTIIPFDKLWAQYERVIKPNGAIVLTASQPFTSALVMSNPTWFRYEWLWKKSKPTGVLNAKRQPLRIKEDILIFCRFPAPYYPQGLRPTHFMAGTGATKANACGNATGTIKPRGANNRYLQSQTGYPTQVLEFPSLGSTLHPTQKPVALFEYLIRTYTNPGEVVLDNCAGSFTTALAAENTGRQWICIEQEAKYCEIGRARLAALQPALALY